MVWKKSCHWNIFFAVVVYVRDGDIKNPSLQFFFTNGLCYLSTNPTVNFFRIHYNFFSLHSVASFHHQAKEFLFLHFHIFFSHSSQIFKFPLEFYLPEVSFSCSTKSRPVMSATSFGSIFDRSSRSGSLSIEILQRFDFICPTSFFKCTFSPFPALSMESISFELCAEIVK